MWKKQTVRDIDVEDKVVLLRVDYNVPMEHGRITEDYRVRESVPTINYLLEHGARQIVVVSHLGRPEGRDPELSLEPIARRLEELLKGSVRFWDSDDRIPEDAKVVLLENLRFHPGEDKGDLSFAEHLVAQTGATLFVQDAFGFAHRPTASMVAITKLLPSVSGLLLEKEVAAIDSAMQGPERPLLAIIGGSKVADKEQLIELFAKTADTVALGGRLGLEFHNTLQNVVAPIDYRYGRDEEAYDIGDISTATIVNLIREAGTVIWNGVVGMVEEPEFAESSRVIAEAIGESQVQSLILGGDTAGFVISLQEHNPKLRYSLISTGGGSALELILGKELPGITALPDKK
ncbi:phosphoglycerate kinase [Candidatus Saccharibacteria bacterium]|nr:phosphoglycerate kinase [Candidatus Saccharibacteria bacterium]